jgi:hypothetical protein
LIDEFIYSLCGGKRAVALDEGNCKIRAVLFTNPTGTPKSAVCQKQILKFPSCNRRNSHQLSVAEI